MNRYAKTKGSKTGAGQAGKMVKVFALIYTVIFTACTSLSSIIVQAAEPAEQDNNDGNEVIRITAPHKYADVFLDTDRYIGSMTIEVADEDVGKEGSLHLVAMYEQGNDVHLFTKTTAGWRIWDQTIDGMGGGGSKILEKAEVIEVLNNQQLLAGTYRIAAAYKTDQGNKLVYSGKALGFSVRDASLDTLQRFNSEEAMSAYIKEGMQNSSNVGFFARSTTSVGIAEDAASFGLSSVRVSTTNLQETGVDEADIVKTDGDNLYVLNNCDFQACLDVYSLNADVPVATRQAEILLDNSIAPDGMYLVQDRPGSDMLVTVAGQNSFYSWVDVWGWAGNSTEIEFFNADQPENPLATEKLTLDGSLVSSRLLDDTLYVVTRFTPYVDTFTPRDFDDTDSTAEDKDEENSVALDDSALSELIPEIRDSSEEVYELISAENCYLPLSAVDRNNNPSIITITGIPLENPAAFESVCFLGGTEAMYMTTESLYLATTQWDYQIIGGDALIYQPDHSTAIHKFSLTEGSIAYQGSGEVQGHLGWSEGKKSFRMGENGDYLNVVTSLGDTWNETSSTRLTVLKDSAANDELEVVNVLDGIGKPGEQLYAARFVGNRAYLVTFRIIDPLYVLDLSDQENPVIAGELEIDGYSDYLHPVSESLLLGIGKDAVPDDDSFDFGGRGAWYQGVKLSLFDVADPANPQEIDSLVLGNRGTESAVLWDHHALSFLPASGNESARLALPIQLHDTEPDWEGWDSAEPSAWYDYTQTALYSFELSDLGISQLGELVGDIDKDDFVVGLDGEDLDIGVDNDEDENPLPEEPVEIPVRLIAPIYSNYNDRSVLLNDAVFYIHKGEVLSSFWGESR